VEHKATQQCSFCLVVAFSRRLEDSAEVRGLSFADVFRERPTRASDTPSVHMRRNASGFDVPTARTLGWTGRASAGLRGMALSRPVRPTHEWSARGRLHFSLARKNTQP
jgi:hypothetical protein